MRKSSDIRLEDRDKPAQPITREERAAAQRVVHRFATDDNDEQELLGMLGIDERSER